MPDRFDGLAAPDPRGAERKSSGGRLPSASAIASASGCRFRPEKRSIAASSSRAAVGEFGAVLAAAGEHHRGEVVGAEILLDEILQGRLHARRGRERRVQIVEDDHVDTSLGAGIAPDVRLDRGVRKERPLGAFDRNVDRREGGDLLRPAVLPHLEVVDREIGDGVALRIGDHRVDLDVVDFDAEGRRRRLLGSGLWRLAPAGRPASPHQARRGGRQLVFAWVPL